MARRPLSHNTTSDRTSHSDLNEPTNLGLGRSGCFRTNPAAGFARRFGRLARQHVYAVWCPFVPVSRPEKCPWGAKLHACAAAFRSHPAGANEASGLGPKLDVKGFVNNNNNNNKSAAANWRRKPPFWVVSAGQQARRRGSRRRGILGRPSGVCAHAPLGRSVGMGLSRAPVMPKHTGTSRFVGDPGKTSDSRPTPELETCASAARAQLAFLRAP